MGDLIADLFVSLDGYASGDFGPYFGYGGPDLDDWIHAELDQPQLVLLGRVTYQALAAISGPASDPVSGRLTAQPKLVASSTLSEPLDWANARLLAGDAVETLPPVVRDTETPIRTMGSLSLVRSLLAAGLLDRLRLMVFPLTCGSAGRERIFGTGPPSHFEVAQTRILDSRVVLLDYRTTRR